MYIYYIQWNDNSTHSDFCWCIRDMIMNKVNYRIMGMVTYHTELAP